MVSTIYTTIVANALRRSFFTLGRNIYICLQYLYILYFIIGGMQLQRKTFKFWQIAQLNLPLWCYQVTSGLVFCKITMAPE